MRRKEYFILPANFFVVWLSRRQMESLMICCFGRVYEKKSDLIEIYNWKEEDSFNRFSR